MKRRWSARAGRVLLLAALAYAGYCAFFYTVQRQLLFPLADGVRHPFRAELRAPARLVEPAVSFGRARGVFLPGPAAPAPALLFFHGNGETVDEHLQSFDALRALGLHVLLVELPGYAGADGQPGFQSLVEVSTAAYDWLAQQPLVDRARIVALGRSIGGAPAAELSRHRPLAALVLLSTFASTADLANDHYLPSWLVRDPFDSAARIAAFPQGVLLMHGDHDTLIPPAHARKLAAASPRTQLHREACGHNDCAYFDRDLARLVGDFLRAQRVLTAASP
ncbi:MAG TPA: alpha/beta hydrolase [Tahibacter sp.]|uniref:alpha/beta hydrolase n=1 Tax=Tahibacter sp. TaxID=2056211 RepID=UPI002BF71F4A|nr:alpha/beta hydrolase [Tahibacter sp.]HSX59795.1 alpha/beta hydrolase [Tahibacter sp.]